MIVLDSSAAVAFLIDAADGEWVGRQLEADPDLHAPHLLDIEVVGALRRILRHGDVSRRRAEAAVEDLEALDVSRYPHVPLLPRVWELRDNLTVPDAAFVALAEALGARLLTTDRALAGAPGIRTTVLAP